MSASNDAHLRAHKAGAYLEQAALELTDFTEAFDGVSRILEGRSFHMVRVHEGGEQEFHGAREARPILESYFGSGWDKIDTWSRHAQIGTRNGRLVTDRMMIPPHIRERDTYFQEFCKDWDLGHYAAWTFEIGGQYWGYTLIRPHGHDYTDEDSEALEALRPATIRSALLACAFRDARVHGVAEGLERSGRPSLVLDHTGRISFATRSALRHVGSGFSVKNGQPVGLDTQSEAQLRRLRNLITQNRSDFPASFPLTSPLRQRPLIAVPMSLRDDYFSTLPGARALLMLIDPEERLQPPRDVLRAAFGLTGRETDLAMLLAAGHTIAQAAEQLQLRLSSTRQLTKMLLAKTGSPRQAELVTLLQRLSGQQPTR
jgi:DNA-binding CsgD family transcriptional regulator